jgi:outer membrane protein assembly factor BamA
MKYKIVFILLIVCTPCFVFSQKLFTLKLRTTTLNEIINKIKYQKLFSIKEDRDKEIQNIFLTLIDNAYLTAKIDSSSESNSDTTEMVLYINPGAQYKWANLKKGNVNEGILNEVKYRDKFFIGTPFHYTEVRKVQENILRYCENNGYPFASIKLDSIHISENSIGASLHLQKNLLVKIDSVVNRGDATISSVYLQNYLGIRNGNLYNEELIQKIETRIKELSFLKEKIPFRILFPSENARVELFLEKKRSNQFDGIVGLLPNTKTGKLLFTGDVRLKLNNSFNRGELLVLNWRRLRASTQDLISQFVFPFIFKTPFGIDANFKLYKKDSTFLEVNPNIGIQYHFSGENYLNVFVNRRQLTLLSTKVLQNITVLPLYADITSSVYGLSIKSEKLDYRLNPRKGYSITGMLGAGNKLIRKNDKLDASIYNGIKLNSVQYSAALEASIFLPVKKRSTLKIGNKSGFLQNANLFQNELFRIGGLKTLRGFDEESVLASSYYIFTLEYRYLLEENSYLYFFADGAYCENRSVTYTGDRFDTPYGFGTGISFQTKAGIFSINYALGSQLNNPINIRTGKVHFGIVNYF